MARKCGVILRDFGTYKSAEEALREEVTTYGKVVRIYHYVDV